MEGGVGVIVKLVKFEWKRARQRKPGSKAISTGTAYANGSFMKDESILCRFDHL